MSEPFPEGVRLLLRDHLTSFERLEVLVLMHSQAPAALDTRIISERLRIAADHVSHALAGLEASGLIARAADSEGESFRLAPANEALAQAVADLVTAYRDQSAAILSAMSVNAIERIRSGPMRAFADSFVLGKRKGDG